MKTITITVFSLLLFLQCTQRKSIHITELSQKSIEKSILIDVRTPEEYQEGHLENAINIDWYDADFSEEVGEIEGGKSIYVYCKKGGRSAKAASLLDSLGYQVTDLIGGYDAFIEATAP